MGGQFLSTLSLRRATAQHFSTLHDIFISIHALLAESDHFDTLSALAPKQFLSTLSLRRATSKIAVHIYLHSHISIHALLAESDTGRILRAKLSPISIHALLAESDGCFGRFAVDPSHFYPRSPCGERHNPVFAVTSEVSISIHALLAESDAL